MRSSPIHPRSPSPRLFSAVESSRPIHVPPHCSGIRINLKKNALLVCLHSLDASTPQRVTWLLAVDKIFSQCSETANLSFFCVFFNVHHTVVITRPRAGTKLIEVEPGRKWVSNLGGSEVQPFAPRSELWHVSPLGLVGLTCTDVLAPYQFVHS